jgi:hypothetical protein
MEYWTILWITFIGGPFDGQVTFLAYPSYAECTEATRTVSDTLSYDHNMECERSSSISGSIRPLKRPEAFGNG